MKPEMSTAVMIERVRELATDSSDSQDCVLLAQVANRIELLLAAESGMSREMACIRHALDIPPDQSVQSGVVDTFVRLNAKIQDLSAQLAALGKQDPVYQYQSEIYNEDSGETELYWDDCDIGFYSQYAEDRRRILYSAPVPPAANQPFVDKMRSRIDELETQLRGMNNQIPVSVPDYMTYLTEPTISNILSDDDNSPMAHAARILAVEVRFWRKHPLYSRPLSSQTYTVPDERAAYEAFIAKRLGDSIETQRAKNGDPKKPDYMAWDMTVGWIAWQARAAMFQSGNSPVVPDGSATPIRYMNRHTGACFTLGQQPDAATDTDVYIPLVPMRKGGDA